MRAHFSTHPHTLSAVSSAGVSAAAPPTAARGSTGGAGPVGGFYANIMVVISHRGDIYRVRTVMENLEKSWNFKMVISRPGKVIKF